MAKKQEDTREFSWGKAFFLIITLIIIGFFLTIIMSIFMDSDIESMSGNVAVIPIKGVILGDDGDYLFDEVVSSEETIELIEKAAENPNIKAITLEINSPGGSPVASEEIASAIKKTGCAP